MAASLIKRTGAPRALLKLNPIHPLPKCFGSFMMRPFRTGAGKPIEATSNFQPRTFSLSFAINCCGLMPRPDPNSHSLRRDMSSLMYVPPTSTTRTFFFMSDRPKTLGWFYRPRPINPFRR